MFTRLTELNSLRPESENEIIVKVKSIEMVSSSAHGATIRLQSGKEITVTESYKVVKERLL